MSKIVIIGAGSLVFSSRLTVDILTHPALEDSEFTLVDVDDDRLSYAEQIVHRIFKEGGYTKAKVCATKNRQEALKGADYVIVSILVGGYEAIQSEIDIPAKYGIDQCIGDTLTPGGIMRCLRTLPILQEVSKDITSICPQAHVLNYTNPMGMLSWGMTNAAPQMSYIGLCHSVQGTAGEWAKRLNIPEEEINYICSGINHQAWFTHFEHKGKDLLPDIRELALDPKIWYGDSTRMEYVKHLGYPVTESSGHVSEYNPWFRKNEETRDRYCPGMFSDWNGGHGFIKTLYDRPDWKEEMQAMASWEKPVSLERSQEYGATIINAIETGVPAVVYGSVPNRGYIDNLPEGAVVEVPCLVDKNGIQPVRTGALPPHLAAINRTQLNVQELAVEATEQKDPEMVFQAMAMDPLTAMSCTLDDIRDMTRELLQAHAPWINLNGELAAKPRIYQEPVPESAESHIDPAEVNNQ